VGLKRGDIVTVAFQGDFGKPRPAVVVESDSLPPTDHILVCIGTSHLVAKAEPRRVLVLPDAENGLHLPTQFQSDKVAPARRDKCGGVIGRIDRNSLSDLTMQLGVILGLAD
jgi:mRNA interferase MazF